MLKGLPSATYSRTQAWGCLSRVMIWSVIYESGPALITPFSSATWKMCLSRARWHLLDMLPFILLLVGIYHLFRGEDRNWGSGHRFDGLMIWLGFPLNLLMHILCHSIHHIISKHISWHWLNTLLLVQCMVGSLLNAEWYSSRYPDVIYSRTQALLVQW